MKTLATLCAAAMVMACASVSQAAIEYDQNVTPGILFGSGNANGGFTVDRSNGIELGLRAKLRHDANGQPQNTFNSNGDGTYSFNPGVAPGQSSPTGEWSFEWSINTDYLTPGAQKMLDTLDYEMGIIGPGGQNVFDPIRGEPYYDHAIGDNTTAPGGGIEATDAANYDAMLTDYNVAQNSWKPHWFLNSFDPTVEGIYTIYLSAHNDDGEMARTSIDVIVGNPEPAPVPEPATMILWGLLGAGCIGGAVRRRKNG